MTIVMIELPDHVADPLLAFVLAYDAAAIAALRGMLLGADAEAEEERPANTGS